VAEHLPAGRECIMHSENGLLGMGPAPAPGAEDPDLINAGKQPVSVLPGGAFFHHADSFAMIRGGHIDVSILGAYEVAANGDLANWALPGAKAPAVGGAMDLVAGVKRVIVLMEHTSKDGASKLVKKCTLPLTGIAVVDRIYTELGIFDVVEGGLKIHTLAEGVSKEEVMSKTEARIV
jgi:3-oxoadipate CoA-transferase beta subunit